MMESLLALYEAELYVRWEIEQPYQDLDPIGHENWKKNDNYANHLITQNVSDEALVHIQYGSTLYTAWKTLESIYEDKSQRMAVVVISNSGTSTPTMTLVNISPPSKILGASKFSRRQLF